MDRFHGFKCKECVRSTEIHDLACQWKCRTTAKGLGGANPDFTVIFRFSVQATEEDTTACPLLCEGKARCRFGFGRFGEIPGYSCFVFILSPSLEESIKIDTSCTLSSLMMRDSFISKKKNYCKIQYNSQPPVLAGCCQFLTMRPLLPLPKTGVRYRTLYMYITIRQPGCICLKISLSHR